MSSSVYFKFKSQKEPTRVEFDGTGISVFELKRDIIIKSGLGDGTDFDLAIYTEDGKEEYDDDTTIIPRSTTVVARRLPPMKPGAGRAARYVSGKMPVNAKNASRREQTAKATAKSTSNAIEQMNNAMTEDEKLQAMFAAQSEQWNAQQEEMSHQTPIFKPGTRRPANVPDHEPPNGYICYRCGEKGHWIQLCPTNDNPEFDNRPRVKRTTGIPRSFLKTVDKAAVLAQAAEDDTKAPSGIMVNADGDFVIAEPDKASWEKFQAKTKSGAAAQEVAALGDKELQERGLECPIDKKMFIDPMKTPCCSRTYCNDCITNALIESDFVCPGCQSEGVLIDDLKADEEAEQKIQEYQKDKDASQKKAATNGGDEATKKGEGAASAAASAAASTTAASATSPKPAGATTATTDAKSTTDSTSKAGSKSPTATATSASTPQPADATPKDGASTDVAAGQANNKKRPADTEAVNPKIPKAPKAMQQQQQQQQQQNAQMMGGFGMNGMNGMGDMMNGMGMPGMMNMGTMGNMGMGNMGMMPFGGMPMMNFGMNGMGGMGGNMGTMGNMGNMGNMNMMNPMMGMNGMNGYGNNGGHNNNNHNGGGYGRGNYNNNWNNRGGGYNNGGYNNHHNQRYNNYNNHGQGQGHNNYNNNNNHQGNSNNNHNPPMNGNNGNNQANMQQVSNAAGNGAGNGNINSNGGVEDDAYFRKPVNPTRHFNKPKRVRPSDYREL